MIPHYRILRFQLYWVDNVSVYDFIRLHTLETERQISGAYYTGNLILIFTCKSTECDTTITALPIITSYSATPILCSPRWACCMFPCQISPRRIDPSFLIALARQSLIYSHRRCYNLHILICSSCVMNREGRVCRTSPVDLLRWNVRLESTVMGVVLSKCLRWIIDGILCSWHVRFGCLCDLCAAWSVVCLLKFIISEFVKFVKGSL